MLSRKLWCCVSDEQGGRFHQNIPSLEKHSQGKWNQGMLHYCCWRLKRDLSQARHLRKSKLCIAQKIIDEFYLMKIWETWSVISCLIIYYCWVALVHSKLDISIHVIKKKLNFVTSVINCCSYVSAWIQDPIRNTGSKKGKLKKLNVIVS